MADLSITAANVVAGTGATVVRGYAGAAITAGQTVYLDTVNNEYLLADADSGTAAAKVPSGIALNGAADGQPLAVLTAGPVTLGSILTEGVSYYLSATAGGIAPYADLGSGDDVVHLGIATSASVLDVKIHAPDATIA